MEKRETEFVKEEWDTENPRVYMVSYRCRECGEWVEREETVWVDNVPYHVDCAPNQY